MDGFVSQTYSYTTMSSILHKSSKTLLKNVSFVIAKHLRELNEIFRTCDYPKKIVEIGIQKVLKIPQMELRQPKPIENNSNLTFISTFNPNNPKIFDLVKSGVNTLVENNVNGFKNIRLIHAKRQPPNLKRIFTNSLFANKTAGVFKCEMPIIQMPVADSRCLCCQQLLLVISYTFKNFGK